MKALQVAGESTPPSVDHFLIMNEEAMAKYDKFAAAQNDHLIVPSKRTSRKWDMLLMKSLVLTPSSLKSLQQVTLLITYVTWFWSAGTKFHPGKHLQCEQ